MSENINKALLEAVIKNKPLTVQKLLEAGANPNYFEDDSQITPLHFAAVYNSIEVIPLLIVAGADVYATNIDNETPLAVAEHSNNEAVAKWLSQFIMGTNTVQ